MQILQDNSQLLQGIAILDDKYSPQTALKD